MHRPPPTAGRGEAGEPADGLLLEVAADALRVRLHPVGGPLPGSPRNRVVRARREDGGTVVVKQYLEEEASYVRESAALTVIGRDLPKVPGAGRTAPLLLADDPDHHVVVMEDVGTGEHLAARLLATDPGRAVAALDAWSRSIGALHAAGPGLADAFASEVRRRAGDLVVDPVDEGFLPRAVDRLVAGLAPLGVVLPDRARDDLLRLPGAFESAWLALTPSDACPDNNLLRPGPGGESLVLLDFEGAQLRHPAMDVAYLLVPWPSCWCSWALPEPVARRALRTWQDAVAPAVATASSPEFARDLARAVTLWRWVALSWFTLGAVQETSAGTADDPTAPTRRQRVQTAARAAARGAGTSSPALADLAAEVERATREAWGPLDLELAPAFR